MISAKCQSHQFKLQQFKNESKVYAPLENQNRRINVLVNDANQSVGEHEKFDQ